MTTIADVYISRDDMVDFAIKDTVSARRLISTGGLGGTFTDLTTTEVTTDRACHRPLSTGLMRSDPPVKIGYDAINQRLSFEVDRTVMGSGTKSDFNSFSVYGSANQTGINNLGLTNADNAQRIPIRGGEVLYGDAFVATGEEIQPNDKRYGIKVAYNSELQNFSISSGTTGEAIAANGAIGVTEQQKASNIQVGRYAISETTARVSQPI